MSERPHLKVAGARCRRHFWSREDGGASEFIAELGRKSQRVITHSVESSRHSGDNLQHRVQNSGKQTDVIDIVFQLGIAHADLFRRTTGDDYSFADILGDNGAGAYDRTAAYRDSRENHRARADKDVIVDSHRACATGEGGALRIVIGGKNTNIG